MSGQSHQPVPGWMIHGVAQNHIFFLKENRIFSYFPPKIPPFPSLKGLLVLVLFEILFVTWFFSSSPAVLLSIQKPSGAFSLLRLGNCHQLWGLFRNWRNKHSVGRGIQEWLSQMCLLHWPKHPPPGITRTKPSRLLHPLPAPWQNPKHQLRHCIVTTLTQSQQCENTISLFLCHLFKQPGLGSDGCGSTCWACTREMHQQKLPSLNLLQGKNVHSHSAWATAFVSPAHCIPWQEKLIKRIYFLNKLL